LGVKKLHFGGLNLIVVGATIITSLVCYSAYKPNAYEIYINGNCVAYISDKAKAEAINREILNEINNRFQNTEVVNNLTYQKIIALDSALSSEETLRKNIMNVLNVSVKAVEMKVDGRTIGTLASEAEGMRVIELVGQQYLDNNELKDEKIVGAKNKISYSAKEVHVSGVDSPEELVAKIIESNINGKPLLVVETSGIASETATVKYSTVIDWTDTIAKGQSKVKSKGENGSKTVQKQITFLNGVKNSEKIIKETVTTKPKNEIVLKGTKSDGESTATSSTVGMVIPSRGSVTSVFGERWGRMHEGIDIAGAIGDPIYAALDGEVIYAGWEGGYGNVIKLAHSGNLETVYAHCSSLNVKAGQRVKRGQVIGKVGNTGRSTGPHLHFEVRLKGVPQNPSKYLYNKTES
jgi:murein DD-endopeptidase MepM/ murein hydrolase activator NlpD